MRSAFVGLLLLATLPASMERRPMQIVDLFSLDRLSDAQVSPDGSQVCYVVTKVDVDANKSTSNLSLVATDGKAPPRLLTSAPKKDRRPRWSPDGKSILFESNRSGSSQLWLISLEGGEPRQLTDLATEAGTALWSPDGSRIAFVSAVWPEYSAKPFAEMNKLHQDRMAAAEKNPVKAKVFTKLFFRHWDSYVEDKRQHLFVLELKNGVAGEPRNLTPGDRDFYPTSTTFSGEQDFTFTPDGKFLVTCAPSPVNEAWSTNYDLWRVPLGEGKPENLTQANTAADGLPRFSPDGKKLAFRAQKRSGFEADQWQLYVVDCNPDGSLQGSPKSVSASFDGSIEDYTWSADGKSIGFLAEQRGAVPFFRLNLASSAVEREAALPAGVLSSLSQSQDGKVLSFLHSTARQPNEVVLFRADRPGASQTFALTTENTNRLLCLDLPPLESVDVPGAGGTPMQMWILKPPGFDPNKKWPIAYLVHGGPQGAWMDGWSWRWNPQVWAAQGYVVAMPNPRGSTGFGQKYCDEISGDWGGKCFEDLMAGVDHLEKQPWADKSRIFAAGASFGGYMMCWFQGKTTRFKTLVCHCGVYNNESMYATTEELWFDEWEHGEGKPLWEARAKYQKHSPHLLAANFKTPMLIIHNDLDFRVPVSQGIELFTTLQRLGVPSRFVNFPDEGHWVLKPANSRFWHEAIFAWLKEYCPPGGK